MSHFTKLKSWLGKAVPSFGFTNVNRCKPFCYDCSNFCEEKNFGAKYFSFKFCVLIMFQDLGLAGFRAGKGWRKSPKTVPGF